MLDAIRKPFLFLSAILILLAVLVEIGAAILVQPTPVRQEIPREILRQLSASELSAAREQMNAVGQNQEPPGFGIQALARIDVILLLMVGLMALSLVIGDHLQGRVQGIISLIVGILVFLSAFKALFATLIELMIRVTLLLATPFGTIAYLAMYSFFDRAGAATILGLSWFLKIAAAVCLVLAHQRFLKQYGLILLFLTSLLGSFLVTFLHGFPPRFLVSITDPIAAIINDILALIWAIVTIVYGVIAVIKALKPR
ncbi:MAG TPA: hypothetical protein VGQ36_18145 [Thermoanaerobaculia bacterium]|jgi:hypothetical protein|nr:hypothetical protein [Thermoanaerobaculia bacterium]